MHIELNEAGDPAIREAVMAALQAHNEEAGVTPIVKGDLAVLLRDAQGQIEGGFIARHWMGIMKLDFLYVPADRRGTGLGRRMIATLEHAALAAGCTGVWLNSFTLQAPGFYEKLGYHEVGRLMDRPPGHADVVLAKTLSETGGLGADPASLVVDMAPTAEMREAVGKLVRGDTDGKVGASPSGDLAIGVRGTDGALRGGLWGRIGRCWLHVDLFALPPDLRRDRMGSRVLRLAEETARARGCIGSYLDTFSFQARPFYEKQGYRVYGQIDGYAGGHTRYLLAKRLDA